MQIKTTSSMRKYLCDMLTNCESEADLSRVKVQIKVAEKITESLYAELKFQKLALDAGKIPEELGKMKVHNE